MVSVSFTYVEVILRNVLPPVRGKLLSWKKGAGHRPRKAVTFVDIDMMAELDV